MKLIRRHPLWALIGLGAVARLVLAFAFVGDEDVRSWVQVDEALRADPLHVYDVNPPDSSNGIGLVWPYPPLLLIAIWLPSLLADATGLPFHGTVHLLPILADAAIAVAIYVYLGWRGATERTRLAGAALVALGPAFIAVSGFHGQFDQLAILPAILGLMLWERRSAGDRATGSGALVGVGAAMKTVPALIALPLLASARSAREAAGLVGSAVAVVVVVTLPFLIADPSGVLELREYRGWAGLGGLSLVVDPGHGAAWMQEGVEFRTPNAAAEFVADGASAITVLALFILAVFLLRVRPAPIDGAVLLWLTIYAFSPNFFMNYLVWGLPFFVMAGYLRETAILQAALIPAIAIYYLSPFDDATPATAIYVPTMIGLWGFWVVALVVVARRALRRRPPRMPAVQEPLVEVGASGARPLAVRSGHPGGA